MKFRKSAIAVFAITLLASGCSSSMKTSKSEPGNPGHTPSSSHASNENSQSEGKSYGHSQAQKNGPPSHAQANGYGHKFQYVHYKEANVYHSVDRDIWFWIESGSWKVGANLPRSIKIYESNGVEVEIDSDTPYTHHALSYNAPRLGSSKGNSALAHEKGDRPD